ncbi:hypothetical protein [Nostoc sp. TCL240-02]|nr:hypothetical protein [Nostoc sp. TCL240-02]
MKTPNRALKKTLGCEEVGDLGSAAASQVVRRVIFPELWGKQQVIQL